MTNLDANETVMCFPSFGHLAEDDRTWKVHIRGAVFEPRKLTLRKKLLLRLLRQFMRAPAEALESPIFQERIRVFVAAAERGKKIAVRVGPQIHPLPGKSRRNGHFAGTLHLDADEVRRLREEGHIRGDWLYFDVVTSDGDERTMSGSVQLIAPTGVSVISDIDDTIKHSDVTSRRALLNKTFLQEFQWIEGMARLYQQWANCGATFHYVSSSPWQLYDCLSELCDKEGFPHGTFHLRTFFRLRDHMLRSMFVLRRRGKGTVIRSILETFPRRRFVLVGDSGEIDPEIYAAAKRRYPNQVAAIFIRDLPHCPITDERRQKLLRRTSHELWKAFADPQELVDQLPNADATLQAS